MRIYANTTNNSHKNIRIIRINSRIGIMLPMYPFLLISWVSNCGLKKTSIKFDSRKELYTFMPLLHIKNTNGVYPS